MVLVQPPHEGDNGQSCCGSFCFFSCSYCFLSCCFCPSRFSRFNEESDQRNHKCDYRRHGAYHHSPIHYDLLTCSPRPYRCPIASSYWDEDSRSYPISEQRGKL